MSTISIEQPSSITTPLNRIAPKPPVSATYQAAKDLASKVVGTAADVITAGGTQLNSDYSNLIQQQIEVQKQMMVTSMISNVEKSKHETQMAPVRNIRVG